MSGSTRATRSAAFAPKHDQRGELLVVDAFDAEPTVVLSGNGLAHLLDSKEALPSEPPRVFPSDRPPATSSGGPLQPAMAALNSASQAYFDEDTSDEDATRVLPSQEDSVPQAGFDRDTLDEDATRVLPSRNNSLSAILALDDAATTVAKRRQSVSPRVTPVGALDTPDFRRGIYRGPTIVLTTLAAGAVALILISL